MRRVWSLCTGVQLRLTDVAVDAKLRPQQEQRLLRGPEGLGGIIRAKPYWPYPRRWQLIRCYCGGRWSGMQERRLATGKTDPAPRADVEG